MTVADLEPVIRFLIESGLAPYCPVASSFEIGLRRHEIRCDVECFADELEAFGTL